MEQEEQKAAENPPIQETEVNAGVSDIIIETPIVNGEVTHVPPKKRRKTKRAQPEPTQAEVLEEPKTIEHPPDMQVLKCECGADILPDKDGLYPSRCPDCGTWNDYRGIGFLEKSDSILVCDKCGGLTLIKPDTVSCEHCGAR